MDSNSLPSKAVYHVQKTALGHLYSNLYFGKPSLRLLSKGTDLDDVRGRSWDELPCPNIQMDNVRARIRDNT